ncbi:MAG: flagellar motor protein [Gallionella sp.]|nr:flagellar motor protein [Gallionella sp.]
MDKLTLLGLIVALAGIMTGQVLDGGTIGMLFQGTAFLIVFGGTLGALMVQSPPKVFFTAMRMGGWAFVRPRTNGAQLVEQLTDWSLVARRDGLLALEHRIKDVQDPFLRKGLQMLVDGHGPDKIRDVMDVEIHRWEQLRWQSARVWEAAGGYSPTIGIIGAVLGLMHVMQNLAEPSKLGAGIAVAFVATIYGVAFANLFFLPIANKLKSIIMRQSDIHEMIVDGLVLIASGENPRVINLKLQGYI